MIEKDTCEQAFACVCKSDTDGGSASDLISRGLLLKRMARGLPAEDDISECVSNCAKIARMLVARAPAVPAVEVVHGHWIEGLDGSCMCSECNLVFRYEIGNYCGNCGAKMDHKSEERD
jgi:hypothetical protein